MSVKLEAGQWYRTRSMGIVYFVGLKPVSKHGYCGVLCSKNGDSLSCRSDGRYSNETPEHPYDIIEHLPDCTGFDWVPKPKLQLREGAWYERKDGKVVGPCKPYDDEQTDGLWSMGGCWYRDDGSTPHEPWHLIREVEPPKPPEPKYRAFKNAEEFKPHRDKWWKYKDGDVIWPPACYSDEGYCDTDWDYCFVNQVFDDGTPFGIRIDE